jgi:serine/threonine-protein kinase Psk1
MSIGSQPTESTMGSMEPGVLLNKVTSIHVVETPNKATDLPNPDSDVTGTENVDLDEPKIIPIRGPTPPTSPGKINIGHNENAQNESEAERGRVQGVKAGLGVTSRAVKKTKKKKNKQPKAIPTMTGLRDLTPSESGAEDSDYGRDTPRIWSPIPRLAPLAGASPGSRPGSPGISNLKAQLDALKLGSGPNSRSTSQARSKLGSETPSSVGSDHQPDDTEDMTSYEIQIDQDFAVRLQDDIKDMASLSISTLCPDQILSTTILRKMTASDFTPMKILGTGSFGTVILVRQNDTGRLFAQKQLTKASITVHKKRVEMTKSERSILELVNRHPFIVNLYYAFQDHEKLYLILEYAEGGELFRHLETEKFFPEDTAAFYMAEIVLALDYLHNTVGVIYRDLKPENCLLDAEGHLLLTDFGLSKVAVEDITTPGGSRCNSLGVGTIDYMAPEIVRGSNDTDLGPGYGKACDWWSLGAMACDLMTGKPPFSGANITKTQQNIMHQKLKLPYYLSRDAQDLLSRLLRKEPSKRLGVGKNDLDVIKKHRFFRKIDWRKLENRELEPPIKPIITNPELAENFAPEFTSRPIPDDSKHSRTLSKSDPFGGFSFVASQSLLEPSFMERYDDAVEDDGIL